MKKEKKTNYWQVKAKKTSYWQMKVKKAKALLHKVII